MDSSHSLEIGGRIPTDQRCLASAIRGPYQSLSKRINREALFGQLSHGCARVSDSPYQVQTRSSGFRAEQEYERLMSLITVELIDQSLSILLGSRAIQSKIGVFLLDESLLNDIESTRPIGDHDHLLACLIVKLLQHTHEKLHFAC
jgi:hypothetical protein